MRLVLNTKAWGKFPWKQAAPYNASDIVVFLSRNTAVVVRRIRDDGENINFSISQLMQSESYSHVFACVDFEKSLQNFVSIMDTRLERFFKTEKADYIFFDEEEQSALKDIVKGLSLSCQCEVLRRKKDTGTFESFNIMNSSKEDWDVLGKMLKKLGVEVVTSVDEYMRLKGKRVFSFRNREDDAVKKILQDFPEFDKPTKKEIKQAYRNYSKDCHPDTHPDDDGARFARLNESYEILCKTSWYEKKRGE